MAGLADFVLRDPDPVALVVTSNWPTDERPAYGIFVRRQVGDLRRQGIACDVLFVQGYRSRFAYPAAALLVARLNLRGRYRVVHAHGGEAALAARAYLRAPLVISYSGSDLLADWSRLRRFVVRALSHFAARTITKTRGLEDALPPSVRARNTVIPNGVDRDLFAPIDRADARRSLGWAEDERVVLFAGDPQVPLKRYPLAHATCFRAAAQLGDLRLHVASGVDPAEMPALLSAADCLLLTSASEGSPNVVKEALSCNLPVVSTAVGDVAELLDGVEPSAACDDREEALADALVTCLATLRRSNGRERTEWLAADVSARRVIGVYERAGALSAPELVGRVATR